MSASEFNLLHVREIAKVPESQMDYVAGILKGAREAINLVTTSGDDPTDVECEFRDGSCYIYLLTGIWVGEADFSRCYASKSLEI